MTLQNKLLRANVIQMIAIAIATLLGVFITAAVMEQFLLRAALESEATYFWEQKALDSQHPLPHTLNMIGYFKNHKTLETAIPGQVIEDKPHKAAIPQYLIDLPLGFHSLTVEGVNRLVHVSERQAKRLYLIINEEQITELSFFFGVIPLVISLAGLYLLSWLTQRLFVSTVSPISQLAKQLESIDVSKPTQLTVPESVHFQDTEIMTLYDEAQKLLDRIQSSMEREKRFSRDASHELRTPLAVIRGSLDILKKNCDLAFVDDQDNKYSKRMNRSLERAFKASYDMRKLIGELLLLAREDYQQVPNERINCNELLDEIAEELSAAFNHKNVQLTVTHESEWTIYAPRSVLRVVIANVVANALRYTDEGEVVLSTTDCYFMVKDTGIGFDPEFLKHAFQPFSRDHHENTKGFGLGLSIVRRFCDHYGWNISIESERGKGTEFKISLDGAITDDGQC